jgi:hypothetical protein
VFELPVWVHDTLERQLEMNPTTWDALREHGVDETTDLQPERRSSPRSCR